MRRSNASRSSVPPVFAAIDFETADYGRDSACAVAVVRVERSEIVDRVRYLIRPPRRHFVFSYLHGITWDDVVDARVLPASLRSALVAADYAAADAAASVSR